MGNPFNNLNPRNPYNMNNMAGIRSAYNMLANSQNPMQLFQQLVNRNPQFQPIINALRNGTNPQQLFVSLCQQRGINPQEFLKNIVG